MKHFVTILLLSLLTACYDPKGAVEAAEHLGLRNVQVTGYSIMACGQYDYWSTGFTAIDQNGKPVMGVVCAGIMKGATVRFFN